MSARTMHVIRTSLQGPAGLTPEVLPLAKTYSALSALLTLKFESSFFVITTYCSLEALIAMFRHFSKAFVI